MKTATRQKAAQKPQGQSLEKPHNEQGKTQTLSREAQGGLTTHAEVDRSNQNAILGEISFCRKGPERFAESRRYFIYPKPC